MSIADYKNKIIVIKYGGNAMKSEELKNAVMDDIKVLCDAGVKAVLVHGGGPAIDGMLKRIGKEPEFLNGLRVTDEETMEIVQMVLAGKVNKDLVSLLGQRGVMAIGLCGMDGTLIEAEKQKGPLGFVGDITKINTQLIFDLLDKNYVPVISTIGVDKNGLALNINGDTAASYVAGALKAEKIIMLTDVPGVLMDKDDSATLIEKLTSAEAEELMKSGVINGGMIPKCGYAALALRSGVKEAVICDGRVPNAVTRQLSGEKNGTVFTE